MDRMQIKKVHVVFKTHLDIGYTNLGANVMDQYLNHHIPHSLELAFDLNTKDNKKFIWTVGSYLIDYYFKNAEPQKASRLDEAIRRGDICWHSLACTTHTELLDRDLLDYNLSISDKLDEKYGKKTISAKMTDVPGHTRAMVELLAEHGVKYIHLGVNPTSMVPEVPLSFVWKVGNHDVITQYSFTYGSPCYVEGMDEVLEFAHTGDNMGPQSEDAVCAELDRIQALYPNAAVVASTMDDYAESLLKYKNHLPIVEEEIGDTWIHGIGSDPLKVSRYRALVKLKNQWKKEGRLTAETEGYEDFMINLIMIAEHTWGLDFRKYLADFRNWRKKDFQAAREKDETTLEFLTEHNLNMLGGLTEDIKKYRNGVFTGSYQFFESSHEEQMEYIWKAVCALPEDLKAEAEEAFTELEKEQLYTYENAEILCPYQTKTIGKWQVAFGGNGEINYLATENREWITKGFFGRMGYTVYDAADCKINFLNYNRELITNDCWAESDFSKPSLETVEELKHGDYVFGVSEIKVSGNRVLVLLQGTTKAIEEFGCPAKVMVEYDFGDVICCRLHWSKKDANKIPEALWFGVNMDVENANRWMLHKMGHQVSPLDVVKGGNRRHHCVEEMYYEGADGKVTIKNIHSPLVSMGGNWLYGDYRELPDLREGFSYCLFDNKWGTNFKMWCEDDCTFEYEIVIEDK